MYFEFEELKIKFCKAVSISQTHLVSLSNNITTFHVCVLGVKENCSCD